MPAGDAGDAGRPEASNDSAAGQTLDADAAATPPYAASDATSDVTESLDGGQEGSNESGAPAPNPGAFVAAYLSPTSDTSAPCPFAFSQSFSQLGSPTEPVPQAALNGGEQDADAVNVRCSVDASADGGFSILLVAGVDGYGGGELEAMGTVSSLGGTGIFGAFSNALYGTYMDDGCTITFTYEGVGVTVDAGPVSAGEIWGHLDCPAATDTDVEAADGGVTSRTCDGHADFRFVDCE